jgi:hypothetical protein
LAAQLAERHLSWTSGEILELEIINQKKMDIQQIETAQLQAALECAQFWIRELGPRTRRNIDKIRQILSERYFTSC